MMLNDNYFLNEPLNQQQQLPYNFSVQSGKLVADAFQQVHIQPDITKIDVVPQLNLIIGQNVIIMIIDTGAAVNMIDE
jgi:hypothetical protein